MLKFVCFDLDDTLYKEIDFLKSGFKTVAEIVENRFGYDAQIVQNQLMGWYYRGENAFANLNTIYGINNPIEDYLSIYRYHHPTLSLSEETRTTLTALKECGVEIGIITDGRKITQMHKIEALGLVDWISFDNIIINENRESLKPHRDSFVRMSRYCKKQYPNTEISFFYVGDNVEKDFLAPNQLGWESVCLEDDGRNIHKQHFDVSKEYMPKHTIKNIVDLLDLIILPS